MGLKNSSPSKFCFPEGVNFRNENLRGESSNTSKGKYSGFKNKIYPIRNVWMSDNRFLICVFVDNSKSFPPLTSNTNYKTNSC